MHVHIATVCRWKSENRLWKAVHSFHNVGPRDRTQVFKLSSKLLYLVCHLTGLVINSSTACLLSLLASLATRQAILCSVLMLFYGYQVFTLPMRIPRSFLRFDSTRLGTYLLNVSCTDFPLVSNVKIRKDISRLNGWPADEALFFLPNLVAASVLVRSFHIIQRVGRTPSSVPWLMGPLKWWSTTKLTPACRAIGLPVPPTCRTFLTRLTASMH